MRLLEYSCVVLLTVIGSACAFDREIQSELNPGCLSCNTKNITLLYVKATGKHDVIHNLWDFTRGKPTFLYCLTEANTALSIMWSNDSTPLSIELSEEPKYSFGIIIDKIWEYNDVNGTGMIDVSNKSHVRMFDTADMLWERKNIIMEESQVMAELKASSYGQGSERRQGEITIKLDMYPYTAYGFELPHLVHSANSTLMDITLDSLQTTQQFGNYSRFAVELLFISTEKTDETIKVNVRKALDDEHTPGIFEVVELLTPESLKHGDGGFVQYRPVAYTKPDKSVSTSTVVNIGGLSKVPVPDNSTAGMFYKKLSNFTVLSESGFVSLGGKSDGFYKHTKYNSWSFTMGYGSPPREGFSLFVILIISIGLGIPALLMVIGVVYVCVKRRKRLSNQPEILIED